MVGANVGSLLVREGGRISGIVTERDYLRRVALERRTSRDDRVREICLAPDRGRPGDDDRRVHGPDDRPADPPRAVVDGGEVVGVVSIGDVVKSKSEQQSFELQYLTSTSRPVGRAGPHVPTTSASA